jgi:hypothetical protein
LLTLLDTRSVEASPGASTHRRIANLDPHSRTPIDNGRGTDEGVRLKYTEGLDGQDYANPESVYFTAVILIALSASESVPSSV